MRDRRAHTAGRSDAGADPPVHTEPVDHAEWGASRASVRSVGAIEKRAVTFFKKHGGYSTRPGETKKKAIQNSAERLARAEQYGTDMGWTVTWDYDQEEYQLGDAEETPPSEVLVAVLRDSDGNVIGSLGGIGDPDDNYKRVVEAELALEAMPGD